MSEQAFKHIISHKHLEFIPMKQSELCIYLGEKNKLFNKKSSITIKELSELKYIRGVRDFFSVEHHFDDIVLTGSDHLVIEMLKKTDLCYLGINIKGTKALSKISAQLIRENQSIVIEDLKVSNMLKNHKLAKAISEVSWHEFRVLLEYKAKRYGRELIIAPSNYASSQLCSECGYKNKEVKKLAVREWICPNYNTKHDRDINASKNLLKLAI